MPKKILLAIPEGMLEMVDFIAQTEHRTRSDLVREAIRRYADDFRRNHTFNCPGGSPGVERPNLQSDGHPSTEQRPSIFPSRDQGSANPSQVDSQANSQRNQGSWRRDWSSQ